MINLKRFFALAMAVSMVVGLSACGKKDEEPVTSSSSATTASSSAEDGGEAEEVDGTPISLTTPIDYTFGTTTVHSEWIQFAAEPYVVEDIFSPQILAVGDYLIVLADDTKLGKYKNDGGSLTLEDSWTLDEDYENLCAGPDDTFFLSGFMKPLIQMDLDGNKIASYESTDNASVNPDGKSGIVTWPGSTPEKLTISDTSASREPIAALEGYFVSESCTSKDHMFIMGSAPDNEKNKAFVLDKSGSIVQTLGGDESLTDDSIGSATHVLETDKYYIVLDGNLRKILLFDKDGTFAGKLEAEDIFGTSYPWICTATIANDGTIYVGLTQGREEENSKDELLVFTLSGF